MTNLDRELLRQGKIKQADVDKKEAKQVENKAKIATVKADKGKDKTKLSKAELIVKIAELEAIIESLS